MTPETTAVHSAREAGTDLPHAWRRIFRGDLHPARPSLVALALGLWDMGEARLQNPLLDTGLTHAWLGRS